jgi:hypothetical protein
MSPREGDAPTLAISEGAKRLTPAAVGRTVKDLLVTGIKALPHRETMSREEHERLFKLSTHIGTSFSSIWKDLEMAAKLTAELVAEENRQHNTPAGFNKLIKNLERAMVSTAANAIASAVEIQARKDPESVTPQGRFINSVGVVSGTYNVLNRFFGALGTKAADYVGKFSASQDTAAAQKALQTHNRLQAHLEDVEDRLQIAARQQQQYLALADANLIGPDGYPVSADLHARRGDRFALTYNPHGATAPERPPRGSIFDYPIPFLITYPQQKRKYEIPIERLDPSARDSQSPLLALQDIQEAPQAAVILKPSNE